MKLEYGNFYTKTDFPKDCINDCFHQGDCFDDVSFWVGELNLEVDEKDLIKFLKKFGAWDNEDLTDHNNNLERLLWICTGDIQEQGEFFFGE